MRKGLLLGVSFLKCARSAQEVGPAEGLVATLEIDECIGMQNSTQLIQHHLKSLFSNIKVSPTIK
jgi:hypothetical protein